MGINYIIPLGGEHIEQLGREIIIKEFLTENYKNKEPQPYW